MPVYRCYLLNELGTPVDAEVVDSPTDNHAEQHAIALLYACPRHRAIEVWEGERKIAYHVRDAN